jgi:hypothetical protein
MMFWKIDYNDSGYYLDLKSESFKIRCWAEPAWENFSGMSRVSFRGQALPELVQALDARKAAGMPSRAKNPELFRPFDKARRAQKLHLNELLKRAKAENPELKALLGNWQGYIDLGRMPISVGLQSQRFEVDIQLEPDQADSSMFGDSAERHVWISEIEIVVLRQAERGK